MRVLSDREQLILHLLAHGYTAREIGEMLHIEESTVRYHLRHAYSKLGATNAPHAIWLAVAHAYIRPLTPDASLPTPS